MRRTRNVRAAQTGRESIENLIELSSVAVFSIGKRYHYTLHYS